MKHIKKYEAKNTSELLNVEILVIKKNLLEDNNTMSYICNGYNTCVF